MSADEYMLEYQHQTEQAICVRDHQGEDIWLPKSQLEDFEDGDHYKRGEMILLTIPQWLAEDKELC